MSKREISIKTADGTAGAGLFTPDKAGETPRTGVILYMDAFGPRPALDTMAQRLSDHGYTVLVPDLFYRYGPYEFDARSAFSNPETKGRLMAMLRGTTQEMTERDSTAFVAALSENGATGKLGTVGYCMGGSRALTAAAALPDRIAAAASFHGGNLASDAPDSPHLRADAIKAAVYVGMAGTDNSFPPEQSARLAEALRRAGVDYLMENYVGAAHGWAVPDHGVFDEAAAERHWKRLVVFFRENLG